MQRVKITALFDHLVGACEQGWRDNDPSGAGAKAGSGSIELGRMQRHQRGNSIRKLYHINARQGYFPRGHRRVREDERDRLLGISS